MSPLCGARHPENGAPCTVVPRHGRDHPVYWEGRRYPGAHKT